MPPPKQPKRSGRVANREKARPVLRLATAALLWTGLIAFVGAALLAPPIAALAVLGMLPTMAAWIVDAGRNRYLTTCIGATNVCGVAPVAILAMRKGPGFGIFWQTLADPFIWLAMFGSAAIGWALFTVLPPLVQAHAARKIARAREILHRRQRELAEEWGNQLDPAADQVDQPRPA